MSSALNHACFYTFQAAVGVILAQLSGDSDRSGRNEVSTTEQEHSADNYRGKYSPFSTAQSGRAYRW